MCLSVIVEPQQWGGLGPLGMSSSEKKICIYKYVVKRFRPIPMTCQELPNMFLRPDGFTPTPKSKDKDPPFFGFLWLFIEYIRRYFPRLDLVFSLRNLRVCHTFVTGTHSALDGIVCIWWWINNSIKFTESWLPEKCLLLKRNMRPGVIYFHISKESAASGGLI